MIALRRSIGAVLLSAALPGSAPAQPADMRGVLSFLVTNQTVQTGDFVRDQEAAEATSETISRALLAALAAVPLTSPAGGFVYTFNPALGTVERASESFGPFFLERALTAGRGQASLGVGLRVARFDRLDGHDLRNGEFVTIANQFTDEPAPFDEESLTLQLETRTATVVGNYGITDRLEIGAAVPYVMLHLTGERLNRYHGVPLLQAQAEGTTRGLGDMVVRAKQRVLGERGTGLTAGADVRLPTGREEDLLGAGRAALRLLAIGSIDTGRVAVHGNLVHTAAGGILQETSYGGALALAVTPRLTLAGELLVRRLDGLRRIQPVTAPHPSIAGVETMRLMPGFDPVQSALAVAGFRWNVGGAWLVNGHLLWSLTDAGLRARVMPTVALDHAF
jgi:hypothetical protein